METKEAIAWKVAETLEREIQTITLMATVSKFKLSGLEKAQINDL